MKNKFLLAMVSSTLLLGACNESSDPEDSEAGFSQVENTMTNELPFPPIAKKIPYQLEAHDDVRTDNYYWLRDDERSDPKMLAHLQAENQYKSEMLAHTEQFQDDLFEELVGRIKQDDSSVPYRLRGYWYYRSFDGENEYPIYARKRGSLEAEEEILIDGNQLAQGHDYFSIGSYEISTDNSILGYSSDTVSRRIYTIQFKDLNSGEMLPDRLEETSGNLIWANDNKTIFYIKKDLQTLLGYQVYRHQLGTDQSDDELVYEETDNTFYTGIGKTRDESLIYIYHDHTLKSGAHILDANTPSLEFQLLHPIEDNHEYSFEKRGDEIYIRTNWNATNFRLMKTPIANAGDKSNWVDVIPHRPAVLLTDFELFDEHLVVREKEGGLIRIRVIDLQQDSDYSLAFDDPVFSASISFNPELSNDKVRIRYSSLTTPNSVFDFDLESGEKQLLKQDEVVGDFDSSLYASERIFITARDGMQVPVSLVYRKDTFDHDGTSALYQYGYGSYGSTNEPSFSASRLSLLDRGVVYAIAHIRGSQMMGREWHEDGKLYNKINSFTDFIDVTKALVDRQYAAPDKVFAVGGSAGGLLMGAVVNMAPELYLGVAAHVPFVDVVTTMLDASIPLTTNEYDEWGNPNEQGYYDYMKSYSPYDNVAAQDYPNLLVTTGLYDSQVQYFEPAKWVAKLREFKTDNNRLVFDINMEAGHGGASGRFRRFEELAMEYAFFFDLIGIKE